MTMMRADLHVWSYLFGAMASVMILGWVELFEPWQPAVKMIVGGVGALVLAVGQYLYGWGETE